MPTRTYPTPRIPEGIKASTDNAKRLLDFASQLRDQGNEDYSYVIYSFTLEEFGKAVLLDKKRGLRQEKVTDNITFQKHEEKLKAAILELDNPFITIPVYEELEPTSEIKVVDGKIVVEGEMKFQEMKQIDNFLSVENRLGLLFVDYDENKDKWITWKDKRLPLMSSLGDSIAAFKRGLDEWVDKKM